MLITLQDELSANQARLTDRTDFHSDIMKAIKRMLEEGASADISLSNEAIETFPRTARGYNNASTT